MHNRVWLGMLAAGAMAPGSVLVAQDPEPPRVEEFHPDGRPDHLMRIVMDRRARLGIKVNLQARDTDSVGAYVEGVTPNGPAAKAGIRSGDVIIKLEGKSVLAGGASEDRDTRQSLPGLRLIELAARVEPGDTVRLEYRRGSERRTTSVVTEEEPEFAFHADPGGRGLRMRMFGPGPHEVRVPAADFIERFDPPVAYREFFAGSPLARLELAPINSDLGAYFGTTEGVLVISTGDSELGLKGGDVVLAVDGRKPAGPSHLLRILRSYESGESFKLDILRNRKRDTVTARLGERRRNDDR